jgi:hypothetical protein
MRSTIAREKSSRSKKLTSIVVTGVATVSYGGSLQTVNDRHDPLNSDEVALD